MRVFLKSQLKNIWKNWFSFIGIFILVLLSVFLTSGSLSAGSNTSNIYKNLDKSLIFPYKVSYSFSEEGLKNISKHFFGGKDLTYEEKNKINNNQILEPTDNNAKAEIKKWNYNFKAWTLQQILIKEGLNNGNQLAVDYQINKVITINSNNYQVMIQNGFSDNNWTINQGKYNLKNNNYVVLTQGRKPENDQEVVTSIDLKNIDNPDFQINNTIKIGTKNYKIVGRGYNFMSYIDYYYQDNIIWLNNSATNDFWLNGSLDDNRDCDYYLNLDYNQMWKFNYSYSKNFFHSSYYSFHETKKILQENIKLTLIKVEILIFNIFGFLVLIASLFIILLFLKKEINQQRVSLGILMSLGTNRKTLSFLIAFAYVTLLVLSVAIGYASAFGLQYYLTKTISKVVFFPFPLLTFNITSTLISLLVFPAIFIICLTLIIYFLLNKPILSLINNQVSSKVGKSKKHYKHKFINNINCRLGLAFAKSNNKKIISTVSIFFLNILIVLFLLNFVNVFNHSTNYSLTKYENQVTRVFNNQNVINYSKSPLNVMMDAMRKTEDFNISILPENSGYFHWVTKNEFLNKKDTTYKKIDIQNLESSLPASLFNCFIDQPDVKTIINDPTKMTYIKNFFSPETYQILLDSIDIWKKNNAYPYFTFGFKIYDQNKSLTYSKMPLKTLVFDNHKSSFLIGYNGIHFNKWIAVTGENTSQGIKQVSEENNGYLNAIIPFELAKSLGLSVGDFYNLELNYYVPFWEKWNKIKIHVVGINNYNYYENNIIVKQDLLFKLLVNNYKKETGKIINLNDDYDSFLSGMLVNDSLPEVNRNIALYSGYDNYYHYTYLNNFIFSANQVEYTSTTYKIANDEIFIANLVKGLETLNVIILTISVIIILILIYVVFKENKKNIISLKLLGYSNSTIVALIIIPYLIGFVFFSIISTISVYFLLQLIVDLLFTINITLIFIFSPSLIFILFLCVILLIAFAYLVGIKQINNCDFKEALGSN